MSKHLIDKPRINQGTRLGQFLKIARSTAPHQTTQTLIARLRAHPDQRLAAYTRIARGREV
ncbi:hypothetical protein LY56_01631 [Roseinatronobacter thiooxidans]|jgi:hypothetical protein|uniref:Uncharacterized protein n=1 Tax=Roseinatronobacter thiooxidans TaxID=121821 RepID=A0A2W7QNT1_9RHOB|nr:hypothetical protein [Roseinatronobacter thiooxidans]PZX45607.1 hypothetical protein LY56_01631 [Roseinatronobacter thiooxidans]